MEKSFKALLAEFMEEKGFKGVARATVTKLQGSNFVDDDGKITGKNVQVSLMGAGSFRVREGSKDWNLIMRKDAPVRPGSVITFGYGSVTTAKGSEDMSTPSGGGARVPITFTNFFDVEITYVQKGLESEAEIEEGVVSDAEYEITFTEKKSTFAPRGKMDVPTIKDDDLVEEGATDAGAAFS